MGTNKVIAMPRFAVKNYSIYSREYEEEIKQDVATLSTSKEYKFNALSGNTMEPLTTSK